MGVTAWLSLGGFQRWFTNPPPGQIRSLAVLPLENLSGDLEQDYFADGMTEQLIANLAKIGDLRMISGGSAMRYRGSQLNPSLAIARLFYAGYLVTAKRQEESIQQIRQAVELDPLSIRTHAMATPLSDLCAAVRRGN